MTMVLPGNQYHEKITTLVILIVLLLSISVSCKKSNDTAPDFAGYVVGTYGGSVPPGILSGHLVVTRKSNFSVNLNLNGTLYENAAVSDAGGGKYTVSLTTGSMTINGTLNGNIFNCYFNQLQFYGVRQ